MLMLLLGHLKKNYFINILDIDSENGEFGPSIELQSFCTWLQKNDSII